MIRCATVASDTLSDKEGFSKRDEVSRSRLRRRSGGRGRGRGRWRAKNSAKKSRAILWRGICTVHSGKSWEAISQLDGLVCHDELYSNSGKTNSPCDLRAYVCVYKKGEKLLGVCTVCLLLIYYRGSRYPSSDYPINSSKC